MLGSLGPLYSSAGKLFHSSGAPELSEKIVNVFVMGFGIVFIHCFWLLEAWDFAVQFERLAGPVGETF